MSGDRVVQLLNTLVNIPSVTYREEKIVDFIINFLNQHGVKAFKQNENAVARISTGSKRALILNGHIDTVNEGNLDSWKSNPFKATQKGGKIYGLGTSDMKAGAAALIELAMQYSTKANHPPCDLWFCFVVGEEVDGRGTFSFLEWFKQVGHTQKYDSIEAVIAEPTNCKLVGIGHRGNAFVAITLQGESGHASAPKFIHTNAITNTLAMPRLLNVLKNKWGKSYRHKQLGVPSIGWTGIESGSTTVTNKIPATATLVLDIRTTPSLHRDFGKAIKEFVKSLPFEAEYKILSISPPGWCPDDSKLRTLLKQNYKQLTQYCEEGASDLCFFSEYNIPAIIFGPGQMDSMHAPNEYVRVDRLKQYLPILKNIMADFAKW